MKRVLVLRAFAALALLLAAGLAQTAPGYPGLHRPWHALLQAHVAWNAAGTATTVDYAAISREATALDRYLARLAAVEPAQFARWPAADRHAFLVNAYNAATVRLVLDHHPGIASIKDVGGLLRSPWKRRFVRLLGATRSLDEIEHGMLRGDPDYADPRLHFAVNCASIGCPALRPEAYSGAALDRQLQDQTLRFLRDRSRNRFDPKAGLLRVSPIFKWYAEDFEKHAGGVPAFLAAHGAALGLQEAQRRALAAGSLRIVHLPYDWALNARPR